MNPIPLFSSLVSIVGVSLLIRNYMEGKSLIALIFSFQLFDMFIGQILEFLSSSIGWDTLMYKIYYFSSPLSAGILAVGVLYASNRGRYGKIFTLYLFILSLILLYKMMFTEVYRDKLMELGEYVGGQALPNDVRIISPLFTIPSGLIILGISLYEIWRSKFGNIGWILIFIGNLAFMMAGGLLRMGYGLLFLVGELIATAILVAAYIRLSR